MFIKKQRYNKIKKLYIEHLDFYFFLSDDYIKQTVIDRYTIKKIYNKYFFNLVNCLTFLLIKKPVYKLSFHENYTFLKQFGLYNYKIFNDLIKGKLDFKKSTYLYKTLNKYLRSIMISEQKLPKVSH